MTQPMDRTPEGCPPGTRVKVRIATSFAAADCQWFVHSTGTVANWFSNNLFTFTMDATGEEISVFRFEITELLP